MVIMVVDGIYFRTHSDTRKDESHKLLHSYLSLDVSLPELYGHWSNVDSHFKNTALRFAGVRILRQDPWECLLGFICSSNNNIARITQMVLLSSEFVNCRWKNSVNIMGRSWEGYPAAMSMYIMTFLRQVCWLIRPLSKGYENWDLVIEQSIFKQQRI